MGGYNSLEAVQYKVRKYKNLFQIYFDLVLKLSYYFPMVQVTIHEAKTHLSRLIKKVLSGEEVIIAKGKEPLVKLVVISHKGKKRRIGGAKNIIQFMSNDFNTPLDDFKEYME